MSLAEPIDMQADVRAVRRDRFRLICMPSARSLYRVRVIMHMLWKIRQLASRWMYLMIAPRRCVPEWSWASRVTLAEGRAVPVAT